MNTNRPLTISIDLRFAELLGGGRVYAWKLLRTLTRDHPEVKWRIYYNSWSQAQSAIFEKLKNFDRREKNLPIWEGRPVKSACLTLKQHVEFLRFQDDAHVYHYLHFDMPLGMRRPQLILTIHDLYPLTVPNYCSALNRAYFFHIIRYNTRRAAKIITISQHTKKDILKWFDVAPDKIIVIPQSHAEDYRPIDDQCLLENVRKKYQLDRPFILITGNHKSHKNLERLIQAYALLPDDLRENFQLLLTGKITPESQTALETVEKCQLGRDVRFLGWAEGDDLPALYNLASLTVLPSLYEGFGLAPLEAMACGTPVACSNTTATPEVVGNLGRQFNPYDIEEMSQAIKLALENDVNNDSVCQSCLAQAAKFSEQKTARQTFDVYQIVAQNQS